jgi:hypothetical protein
MSHLIKQQIAFLLPRLKLFPVTIAKKLGVLLKVFTEHVDLTDHATDLYLEGNWFESRGTPPILNQYSGTFLEALPNKYRKGKSNF